jgi:hypothetical protein
LTFDEKSDKLLTIIPIYTQVNSKFGFRQSWRQDFCFSEIGQYSKINMADFRETKSLDANTAENQILSLLGYISKAFENWF